MKGRSCLFLLTGLWLTGLFSCNREPLPPPDPVVNRISVAGLRQLYEKGVTTIDTNLFIRGIITLTPELGNVPAFIAYLQDSTAGICLSVSGENSFAMDSEVKILCRGVSFTNFNGLLQFGNISIADQTELIRLNAVLPAPPEITLDELLLGKREAEYVMVKNVQFTDPGTYSGTRILTDCISRMDVYTRSDAIFSPLTLPAGNGTFRGIASVYTNRQLLLRDASELDMKGPRCGTGSSVYLAQDFSALAKFADVNQLAGWKSYPEAGGKSWYCNEVSSRKWIQATAFSSGQSSVITWMISPLLDLTMAQKPYLSFESADGYDNGATLELFISSDYAGSTTPWTSNWTRLPFTLPASTPSGYSPFVSSGQIDLSAFRGGPVYLAWVYKGADPAGTASDKSTTWEVDNVVVAEK